MEVFNEFMEFVRGKPADEPYNGMSKENCAIAQFGNSREPEDVMVVAYGTGYKAYTVGSEYWVQVIPANSWGVPKAMDATMQSNTFGELRTTLEKIVDNEKARFNPNTAHRKELSVDCR